MLCVMRGIFLFIVLLVTLSVIYLLVPFENMQLRAKQTIEQVQLSGQSIDLQELTAKFNGILAKQKALHKESTEKDIAEEEEQKTETSEHTESAEEYTTE